MLQRTLCNRIIARTPSLFSVDRINKFSDSAGKDGDNISSDAEKSDDSTVQSNCNTFTREDRIKGLLEEAASYNDANDKSWSTSPYPGGVLKSTKSDPKRIKIHPSSTSIIVFPGQGTLKVGAVNKYIEYPMAKELFETANEILKYDLLKLCQRGPQEELNKTEFNQAATVVTSLAALEKLQHEYPDALDSCVASAGYSVGEITSLIFSGAITYEEGIRIINVRGNAMQYAASQVPQGMMAVRCTPQAKIHQSCEEAVAWARDLGVADPVCGVAIYLYTQGKILAGNTEALQYLQKNSTRLGLENLNKLPVSGAFHTPLMSPALESFGKILNEIEFKQPVIEVYSNYRGKPHGKPHQIKANLMKQIVSPVKWEQCMQGLVNRPPDTPFPSIFDVASGGRMKTILKLINIKAWNSCTSL